MKMRTPEIGATAVMFLQWFLAIALIGFLINGVKKAFNK